MKKIFIAIILALALWFASPLLRPGFIPTHDGEFSIIRIWQYSKMMGEGYLFSRWAPDLNSGYGVPLFTFYYPFPYFVGSLFHFAGLSLVNSFKLTLGFSYITAITLCFLWLKKLFNFQTAIIGTLFFLSVPYWFVNLYVRGSVGEVMAMASLMAVLVGIEYQRIRIAAFALAALIISHNITAFIFLPLIVGYSFFRKKIPFTYFVWGLALSAFFWIPAIVEQKFVVGLSNFDYRDHFPELAQLLIPSWGTGFSRPGWPADEMSQQLGVGVVALLALALVYFRKILTWPLLVSVLILFLMLEASIPVWNIIPALQFIQYPWRLLSVFIPLSAYLGAYIAGRNRVVATVLAVITLLVSVRYAQPVIYESRGDEYYLSKREFTDGTTSVGNSFSTLWLTWQKERPAQVFEKGQGESVIANISYYPGWTVVVDGRKTEVKEANGRIQFEVPPEAQNYELRFRETPLRLVSDGISIVSLFWLIGSGILVSRYAHSNRRLSSRKRA
ncbi:hypothetical protein A3A79_04770 [Candidatus Gottesmanbacteria bacterium RIFCSPLOWO2_01_FULL_43_11b]|uniref:Membrane protein 6-pyruvoyl-tetrahydropterin synthase-related domain-containing protein n=1 Tax=Candidatus Gottesmanbacteria bacterium RIFCSPLOWO2_01_FULL_43_11b TaxID=1798392 RepID=A0A1F6AIE1_9BACT|nr:MAG: hypothetical protein A3A79_04770 [Candidatus Gottesmanbacteria bacterium RIFCSPLOWO2_01_FULL_43_11b]